MNAPSRSSADTARPGSDEQDAPASPEQPQGEREPSGETLAQREEVCEAWAALPDDLRKDQRLTRLYHALGGPRMDDLTEAALRASPAVPVAQDEREFADWFKVWALEPGPDSMRAIAEAAWNASRAALSASTPSAVSAVSAEARPKLNYTELYWFAAEKNLDYNELCKVVHRAANPPARERPNFKCPDCGWVGRGSAHACTPVPPPADNKENGNG